MTLAVAIAGFGAGIWLLVESVEHLISSLTRWALAAGVSGLVLSAVVLGFDVESTAAGVAATLEDLPGTALGTSIGSTTFIATVGLGLAALTAPFSVRPPRAMLAAPLLAAALSIGLSLNGVLSRLDGLLLLATFAPLLWLVLLGGRDDPPDAAQGNRPGSLWAGILAGLLGLVIGAELLVFGAEGIVEDLELSETFFGLIVVAVAVSFEEVVLEMIPAHRGHPEISVGNALGTATFLLTASLGVIALVNPVEVPDAVRDYHAPAMFAALLLLAALLLRGHLGRREGALLIGAYAAYLGGAALISG